MKNTNIPKQAASPSFLASSLFLEDCLAQDSPQERPNWILLPVFVHAPPLIIFSIFESIFVF
jgi:hypothetical protein